MLFRSDNIEYSELQIRNVNVLLETAKKRFAGGISTMTEINEAQANLETLTAKKLEWDNSLDYCKRILETYIGIYPANILKLNLAKFVIKKPEPSNIEDWINIAFQKNPEIMAAQQDIEIASAEVDKSIAGHYPSLDLIASKSYTDSQNDYTSGSKYQTESIGLQIDIPIYYGGYVEANTKSSMIKLEQSQDNNIQKQNEIRSNIRKYFHEIINGIAKIKAYEKAVSSNEIALTGTQKGFDAGFRSNIDVINAEEKLYQAKHDLSKERYTLIYNHLLLKKSAGVLSEQDLQEVSGWLSSKE